MLTMRLCPHCGTPVSEKKHICHHCQREIQPPAPNRPTPVEAPYCVPVGIAPAEPPSRVIQAITQPIPRQRHATLDQRASFYRQLQALLHAGLTPALGLDSIARNTAAPLHVISRDLSAKTQRGSLLSIAMQHHSEAFPEWEVETVHAGEVSGALPEALGDIAEILEAEWELRLQTRARTWYLRVTVNVGLFVLLLVIAVHRLAAINIAHYGQPIPPDVLQSLRTFLFWMIASAFLALIVNRLLKLTWWRMTLSRRWAPLTQTIIRRLPLLGPIVVSLLRLRFLRVLATLWDAGVPPLEAIKVAARATDDPLLRERIDEQLDNFAQGGPLAGVMAASGYFADGTLHMIQSGEQSGSVPAMLQTVARYIRSELDARLRSAPMIAELILFVIVAPLVCYLYAHTMRWYFQMLLLKIELLMKYMLGN